MADNTGRNHNKLAIAAVAVIVLVLFGGMIALIVLRSKATVVPRDNSEVTAEAVPTPTPLSERDLKIQKRSEQIAYYTENSFVVKLIRIYPYENSIHYRLTLDDTKTPDSTSARRRETFIISDKHHSQLYNRVLGWDLCEGDTIIFVRDEAEWLGADHNKPVLMSLKAVPQGVQIE